MSIISVRNNTPYKGASFDNDYIYFNVDVVNKETEPIRCKFTANRIENVLDNPADYELAIVRFKVPTQWIPVMILDDTKDFKVRMSFNGSTVEKQVVYNQNSPYALYNNYIWNYQEFIDNINIALEQAFTDIKLLEPAFPATVAPFWVLNDDKNVSFYAEQTLNSNLTTAKIEFNTQLQRLIPTILYIADPIPSTLGTSYFQLAVRNYKTNSETINAVNYYKMETETSPLALWNDFTNIIFQTSQIPVNPELVGAQGAVKRNVITDFEPLADFNSRLPLQYFPQGPLRWYELRGNAPLSEIDIEVFWQDTLGRSYPLLLDINNNFTVKILFRNKKVRQMLDYTEY